MPKGIYPAGTLFDECDRQLLDQYTWHLESRCKHYLVARNTAKGPKFVRMHRLILNAGLGQIVDHINGNPMDNRRCNLRFATLQQNNINAGKPAHNTSGYRGVQWDVTRQKWRARIIENKRSKHLGYFTTIEAAAEKRRQYELTVYGAFSYHNRAAAFAARK